LKSFCKKVIGKKKAKFRPGAKKNLGRKRRKEKWRQMEASFQPAELRKKGSAKKEAHGRVPYEKKTFQETGIGGATAKTLGKEGRRVQGDFLVPGEGLKGTTGEIERRKIVTERKASPC